MSKRLTLKKKKKMCVEILKRMKQKGHTLYITKEKFILGFFFGLE